jgi:glucosylceramidase
LPEYYDTWALYFAKYITAYKEEGIDIWGITVENEPLGNDSNWESMHFTPEAMVTFTRDHLGPQLEESGYGDVKILGYDQNRDPEMVEFVEAMYQDDANAKYFDGTAVHWYASTVDYFPEYLQMAHEANPTGYLIQSEACIDAEVPHWQDDEWYWSKEATDWGWDWAPEELKKDHPKYVPVYRYARDIIGSLNNWVDGWIDWNMVLDRQGGPNWASNWCIAPVIVDQENDEVYFTPLYYVMSHFSKFIRPGAVRIGFDSDDDELMVTALQNPDGSKVVVLLNMSDEAKPIQLNAEGTASFTIQAQALQTIVLP